MSTKRNPIISGVLSLFTPGLGQLYNCKPKHFFIFILTFTLSLLTASMTGYYNMFIGYYVFEITSILIVLISVVTSVIYSFRFRNINLYAYNKLYIYLFVIVVYVLFCLVYKSTLLGIMPYSIPTKSMEPTIKIGDDIIVDKFYYRKHRIQRGDIIVFHPPAPTDHKRTFIKRCIAIAGDSFSIKSNDIYINGKVVRENYIAGKTNYRGFPNGKIEGIVPENTIVTLGDNRENSSIVDIMAMCQFMMC